MTIYTGVADENGDFSIPFDTNYTGGQKVILTAEKDSAVKKIELFAPSVEIGRDVVFSLSNFPSGIGAVILTSEIYGVLSNTRFDANSTGSVWRNATSLQILGGVTQIPANSVRSWTGATKLDLPASLSLIASSAFYNWTACLELICRAEVPPTLQANGFANLNVNCNIKVPAGSVLAYKSAPQWSAFAARIQAI